jgi:hypothetical protein
MSKPDSSACATTPRLARRCPPAPTLQVSCIKGMMGLGTNLATAILDLSEDGAALLLKHPLQKGDEVQLEFSRAVPNWSCCVVAEAVWCVPIVDGGFCAGFSFNRRLAYRDIQQISEMRIMR